MKKRYKGNLWNKKGKYIYRTGKLGNINKDPNIGGDIKCNWYHQFGSNKNSDILVSKDSEAFMKEYLNKYTFEVTVVPKEKFSEKEEFEVYGIEN